jgi:hypothetical protein
VWIGYETNIGPSPEKTPRVLSFSRTLKDGPDQYSRYRDNSETYS